MHLKHEPNKEKNNGMLMETGKISFMASSVQLNNAREGTTSLSQEKNYTNLLSSTKWAALNTYIKVTLYRLSMLHLFIQGYICVTYIHCITTINNHNKRGHIFGK